MITKQPLLENIKMKEAPAFLQKLLEQYETIKGEKILENLRKFKFNHEDPNFVEACLGDIKKHFEKRHEEISYEELLAFLVRLTIMHFVEKKHIKNMWFLILASLLPEELQNAKSSVLVEKMEAQFIRYMEMLGAIKGEEAIRDGVLKFLFKENRDFTFPVLNSDNFLIFGINSQKVLN
jgi:hypothetical protein